jgi:hypothetical protein
MSGSGIFAEKSEIGDSEASNPANKTSLRMYQVLVLFWSFYWNLFSPSKHYCASTYYYMFMWMACQVDAYVSLKEVRYNWYFKGTTSIVKKKKEPHLPELIFLTFC